MNNRGDDRIGMHHESSTLPTGKAIYNFRKLAYAGHPRRMAYPARLWRFFVQGLDRLVRTDAPPSPAISLVHSEATVAREIQHEAVLTARVRFAALCFLPLAGMVEAIVSRFYMNPDGVSYLDMGDAIMRGDWKMAVNGYWSPLYPFLQGLALRLVRPSVYAQFSVVHFVNFLIYLFALGCFDFLLRAVVANRHWSGKADSGMGRVPTWTVFAVGYAVFFWSSLSLTKVHTVSPDMLMAGFLYLAVAMVLRIWSRPQNYSWFLLLGAVLGFGYLAKAPVFPLCAVFFAVSWMVAGNWRKATPRVFAAVLVFLVVAGPWITALSRAKGRLTFGDSGRVNYVLWVDGAAPSYYFRDLGIAGGRYAHSIHQIYDAPTIYEFATPGKSTLPVWYDASYWADGAVPKFSLKRQLSVFAGWLGYYLDMVFTIQGSLLLGFVVLCFMSGRKAFLEQVMARWPVWLIGLAGLGMFALVHVEDRYIAPFFALFWVGLFSGLKMPPGREGRRLASVVALGVIIGIAGPVALSVVSHLRPATGEQTNNQGQVAAGLRGMGVMPGDRVARIGGIFGSVYWARLLGVTEIAEIPLAGAKDFWDAKPEAQAQVIETFQRLGVTAIVADMSGEVHTPGPEWRQIGDGYFALKIGPSGGK